MSGVRIEFPSDDAARFNELRERWRDTAASCALPKAGIRVATVLPKYVSREFGYAFPTDEQLAADIKSDPKTAKRGLTALEVASLIERDTQARRGGVGIVAGKVRRIYLCLPTEGTTATEQKGQPSSPKGQNAVPPKGQNAFSPKGQTPKGQPEPKGQKSPTEGTYGCPYIPDTHTPDSKIGSGDRKVGVYEETDPSVAPSLRADPSVSSDPRTPPGGMLKAEHPPHPPAVENLSSLGSAPPSATVRSDRTVEPMHDVHELPKGVADRSPLPRNPYSTPKAFGDDFAFLDAFDRFVVEITGDEVPAGEMDRITAEAFDRATDSDDSFMPFHWASVCALTDGGATANWFRWRAGSIIHRKAAA